MQLDLCFLEMVILDYQVKYVSYYFLFSHFSKLGAVASYSYYLLKVDHTKRRNEGYNEYSMKYEMPMKWCRSIYFLF